MPSLKMIAALAVLAAATLPATAQNWPTRQVTMVYPFAAGSAGDFWDASSRRASLNSWASR
jgi:tripartite-type tricarboxylate transporter receptor subunit TctC